MNLSTKGKNNFFSKFSYHFEIWTYVTCIALAVKLETTHKPAQLSTNHPNQPKQPQTTCKPAKPPRYKSNTKQQRLISQKSHLFFPWRHFLWTTTFSLPILCKKRNGCIFFYVPARFHILPSPLHNSLPSINEDYNPSHKLLTKLWAYNVTLKVLWVLGPLKSPLINTLKVLASLGAFINRLV